MARASRSVAAGILLALMSACSGGGGTKVEITQSPLVSKVTATATAGASPVATPGPPKQVAVTLFSYGVTPSATSIGAGSIQFDATNSSTTQVHELVVFLVRDGTTFGEIEDIPPGGAGSITLNLAPGM